jgi:hypothetical protein
MSGLNVVPKDVRRLIDIEVWRSCIAQVNMQYRSMFTVHETFGGTTISGSHNLTALHGIGFTFNYRKYTTRDSPIRKLSFLFKENNDRLNRIAAISGDMFYNHIERCSTVSVRYWYSSGKMNQYGYR